MKELYCEKCGRFYKQEDEEYDTDWVDECYKCPACKTVLVLKAEGKE